MFKAGWYNSVEGKRGEVCGCFVLGAFPAVEVEVGLVLLLLFVVYHAWWEFGGIQGDELLEDEKEKAGGEMYGDKKEGDNEDFERREVSGGTGGDDEGCNREGVGERVIREGK